MSTLDTYPQGSANLTGWIASLEGLVETLRTKIRHLERLLRSRPQPVNRPTDVPGDMLTARQLAKKLSLSVRTVWRYVETGEIPPPVRYSKKLVRFSVAEIEAYLRRLQAASQEVA